MGLTRRAGFGAGVSCGLRGLGRCVTTPALWPWALVPAALTGAVFAAAFASIHEGLGSRIRELVTSWLGGGWAGPMSWVFSVLFAAVALVVVYLVFAPCARVVAAPFLAVLSDRTMRRVLGREVPVPPGGPVVRFVLRPVAEALVFLLLRLAVTAFFLPLLCIPVVGWILFFLALVPLEGLDRMDVAQSSRAVPLGKRLSFVRSHFGACSGLGMVVAGVLLVPVLNVLLLPGLVVGAVLLDAETSGEAGA